MCRRPPQLEERFEKLTKRLLAVPRKELQAKLDKYNREKAKRKPGLHKIRHVQVADLFNWATNVVTQEI